MKKRGASSKATPRIASAIWIRSTTYVTLLLFARIQIPAQGASNGLDRVIELPPFNVIERVAGPAWRYTRAPGIEVLSRCSDNATEKLLAESYNLNALLDLILPPRLRLRSDMPMTYLFFNAGDGSVVSRELLASLRQREQEAAASRGPAEDSTLLRTELGTLPNYLFWDREAHSAFFVWDKKQNARGDARITPAYVRFLLDGRTPALPNWFIDGMAEVYRDATMNVPADAQIGTFDHGRYSIFIPRAHWVSTEMTQDIVEGRVDRVEMLPLAKLFADRRPAVLDSDYDRLRRSQAALFIRWALDGVGTPRRSALWKFVDQASTRPISEDLFQECFGMNYRLAQIELQRYVRMAIGGGYVSGAYIGGIYLRPPESTRVAVEPLRDATVAEVSRIKGGFNRLEIPYVRAVYPALTEKYVDQARRTLRKAYTSGERDPRLLAELGLCECDAGNDAGAIEFLTGAVSARAPRPRCYYELSRIRLASLRKPESSRKLSGQEASRVVEPLLLMRGQQPALGEAYELMAETWLSSSGKPGPEHWAMLEEGVQLFGGRPRLLFLVAFLHRERGDVVNARVLIERGLGVVADPEGRTQFLRLRASLPAFSPEKNP